MNKLILVFKSRTFWAGAFMFILGGVQATADLMPDDVFIFAQGILTALVGYFKVNPSQRYE